MQVTETQSDGLKRELKVVIDAKDLDQRLARRLDEIKDRIRLKGFRPGKVPVAHLRKVYGRSVMAEVVQQAVVESSERALLERDERPAYQPKIDLPQDEKEIERVISGGADLAYTMSFEVLPRFEVTPLGEIELEREVAEVEEADVERSLERLLDASTTFKPKEGAAEHGDQVVIDFEGTIDGEPFEGGRAEDAAVVLGRGSFLPGFEESLLGAAAGETKEVTTTFPADYAAKELAGKEAVFKITIKKVLSPVRPQLDDEFAKTMGLDSVAALREAVKKQLEGEFAAASRTKLKRRLLDALDQAHSFDLPQTLVDNEFNAIWQRVVSELERAGRSFEQEGTSEEKAREEYRRLAERRVRLGLVLSEIGDKNGIQVQEDEVQRALMARLRQFPGQERQVYEFYRQNPQAMAELRAPLFEDKVVDYILELARVRDKKVSAKELFEQLEEPDHNHDHEHGHGHHAHDDHDHGHAHGHDR